MNLTWFSEKTEKIKSGIEGTGLFARDAIEVGEIVVVKGGYVFPKTVCDELKKTLGPADIQITDDLYIGPTTKKERDSSMMYLNHSCAPNVGVFGQISFVAMRDISSGEGLTLDYAMFDDDDYEMTCRCGQSNCRIIITGKDWQKMELQTRYQGYFSYYLARKINDNFSGGEKEPMPNE